MILKFVPMKYFLFFIALMTISCSPKNSQHVSYFSGITGIISPFQEYKGRGPISESDAQNYNHYEFIYDSIGNIRSIRYFKKNVPSNDSYFYAHEVRYDYQDTLLVRRYFNTKGEKFTLWRHYLLGDKIHKEIFTLNNVGEKTRLIFEDSTGNRVSSGLGSYVFIFEPLNKISFIQTQFDNSGNPNTLTQYFPFYKSRISMDENEHLYLIENLNAKNERNLNDSVGYAAVKFNFDEFGNELGWTFMNENLEPSNRLNYLEMDFGFAEVKYEFDWIDKQKGLSSAFSEKYFGQDGIPVQNNNNVHHIRYILNENDLVERVSYFDEASNPVLHKREGFHSLVIEYDSLENPISRKRFDQYENLID